MQIKAAITENFRRYGNSKKNFLRAVLQGFPKIEGLATGLCVFFSNSSLLSANYVMCLQGSRKTFHRRCGASLQKQVDSYEIRQNESPGRKKHLLQSTEKLYFKVESSLLGVLFSRRAKNFTSMYFEVHPLLSQ